MVEYGFEESKDFCSKMSETSKQGETPSKHVGYQKSPPTKSKQNASEKNQKEDNNLERSIEWVN